LYGFANPYPYAVFAIFRIVICENTSIICQNIPEPYYIYLESRPIEMLQVPLHIDTVVGARGMTDDPLGIGFRGLGSKPVNLFLKDGVSRSFSKVLDASNQQRDRKKSILRITYLRIAEYINSGKTSQSRRVAIEAEVAVPTSAGYAVYGPARITETSLAGDVTKGHDEAILKVFGFMIPKLVSCLNVDTLW